MKTDSRYKEVIADGEKFFSYNDRDFYSKREGCRDVFQFLTPGQLSTPDFRSRVVVSVFNGEKQPGLYRVCVGSHCG